MDPYENLANSIILRAVDDYRLTDNEKEQEEIEDDCVGRIIDLENEIRNDMNELLDLKRKIMAIIKAVDNPEHQALLEKRYLCYLSWEKIAVDMGYDLRYIHKLHNRALENVKIPESDMKRH